MRPAIKAILFLLFVVIAGPVCAQEYTLSIKEKYSGIAGKMLASIYQQDQSQFENLVSVLNLDVLGYFKLKNTYNTVSKVEAYKESDDFKKNSLLLQKEKSDLMSETWYLDFEPDYFDEKSISIRYNPDTKSFAVSNNVSFTSYYDNPGFLQFDHLLFRAPSGITISKRNVNYACVDVVEQTISFEIKNEDLVSKIEENRNSIRLMFVFNFTGTSPLPGKTSNLITSDFYLLSELLQVVIYNSSDSEVYVIYR